jgi:hypothetical protein
MNAYEQFQTVLRKRRLRPKPRAYAIERAASLASLIPLVTMQALS